MAPPFLTYLTVFKSRLGISNILLELTGFAHQPTEALARKVRRILEERMEVDLNDPTQACVFSYLSDKRIVGPRLRKSGRYAGYALRHGEGGWEAEDRRGNTLDALSVFRTDIWMADPEVPSTIGVPTPENAGETLELGFQLRLLSPSKNTWTAGGQLVAALRNVSDELPAPPNPFLLGLERVGLLRQIVANDGILLREVLRSLFELGDPVTRDDVASQFADIVDRAYEATREVRVSPPSLREARDFRDLIRKTTINATDGPGGPGVLEHRVSPRLEWLTDLGYLSKRGLRKNAFQYGISPLVGELLRDLDTHFGQDRWGDDVAISQWRSNPCWAEERDKHARMNPEQALREGYRRMQRRIGPAPIAEVAFIASLLRDDRAPYQEVIHQLIDFAQRTTGVSLSGGRYRRTPENIHMTDAALTPAD